MRRFTTAISLIACAVALQGCLAKTVVDVATAPVRIGSKAVDLATTSQSEADEKRGKALRKIDNRLDDLHDDWRKADEQCRDGKDKACEKRSRLEMSIEQAQAERDSLTRYSPPSS